MTEITFVGSICYLQFVSLSMSVTACPLCHCLWGWWLLKLQSSQQKVTGICVRRGKWTVSAQHAAPALLCFQLCNRNIITWLLLAAGWDSSLLQSLLQPVGFSLLVREFALKTKVSFLKTLTKGQRVFEIHNVPYIQPLRQYLWEQRVLTLLSSRLSNGLGASTKHRKRLAASLGNQRGLCTGQN